MSCFFKDTGDTTGIRTKTLLIRNTRVWIGCSYSLCPTLPRYDMMQLCTEWVFCFPFRLWLKRWKRLCWDSGRVWRSVQGPTQRTDSASPKPLRNSRRWLRLCARNRWIANYARLVSSLKSKPIRDKTAASCLCQNVQSGCKKPQYSTNFCSNNEIKDIFWDWSDIILSNVFYVNIESTI